MSNPMLAGLGIKAGDPRFKLPKVRGADGSEYKPTKMAKAAIPGGFVTSANAAVQESKAAEVEEETRSDQGMGMMIALAAACISANNDHGTAAHFWRESAKEMRHEGTVRMDEWSKWADENAIKMDKAVGRLRIKAPDPEPDPDHDGLFTKADVARYRKANEWAKKRSKEEKDDIASGAHSMKLSAPVMPKAHHQKHPSGMSIHDIAEEEDLTPRAARRKNKGAWKKQDEKANARSKGAGKDKTKKKKK